MTDDVGNGTREVTDNTTTGSPKNHWICEGCWTKRFPSRWPVRVRDDFVFLQGSDGGDVPARDVAFICCWCGTFCWSHIGLFDDDIPRHCNHEVYVTVEGGDEDDPDSGGQGLRDP